MRSFALLVALLGLCALAQAQQASVLGGVLLEGAIAEEDIPQTGNVSILHRHWRHHGPPHDPEDHPYWERRHSAKDELFDCLGYAIHHFKESDASTWEWTGKHVAKCILQHLGHCHDLPGLPADLTKFLPYVMFTNGLKALVDEGNDGLLHASMVLGFYIAGGKPQTEANPWYIPGGCASQLVGLLKMGCGVKPDQARLHALAKTFVKALETNQLGACAPDIPAVILALVSTYCPATNTLYNPLNPAASTTCESEGTPLFEDSAGSLLGGSIITLMLLSGNNKIATLGTTVAFAMNRMAVAATQTTSFDNCLGTPQGTGELNSALGVSTATGDGVPYNSGPIPVPNPANPFTQVQLSLPLPADGQRTLCAAIAMVSGDGNWDQNLLWQGTANVLNAIFKTIKDGTVVIADEQVAGLCAVAKALWSFTYVKIPIDNPATTDVTIKADQSTTGENDFSCMTDGTATGCNRVPWGFDANRAFLAAGTHNLGISSPTYLVCNNEITPPWGGARQAVGGGKQKPVGRRGL